MITAHRLKPELQRWSSAFRRLCEQFIVVRRGRTLPWLVYQGAARDESRVRCPRSVIVQRFEQFTGTKAERLVSQQAAAA